MKMLLSALVLVLAADSTLAQPPQPSLEGRTILAVRVSGLDHVKESVVLPQMESVPGQPYSRPRRTETLSALIASAFSLRSH